MTDTTCPSCGRALDTHDRHVRFTLPDPVLETAEQERASGTWMTHATARESVMMRVPDLGAFVRALLPVHLSGGYTVTFGLWMAIDPRELRSVFKVWNRPEYEELRLEGWLANAIKPWGLLATPVRTVVRDPAHTPYCDSSSDPALESVLHDEWPHEVVLAEIDGAAGQPV